MNKKGQSLALFVMFIPIFIMMFTLIFDSSLIISEYIKIKDIGKSAITYLVKDNKNTELVEDIIKKNDSSIEIVDITNKEIHLKKNAKSYFGKIVGYQYYELEVYYTAYLDNEKLIIEKKGK